MATQSALDICYMAVAEAHAELSKAKRRKVKDLKLGRVKYE